MAINHIDDTDMIGAIKIKDGLFIGDEMAAQDLEFVVANKVTRIINWAGRQIPNHWEPIGVNYMTFFWGDEGFYDSMATTTQEIFEFIEETLDKSESVLVHSARGQSRASTVIAIYMMKKYRWTLLKTLEFLNSRRPDLEIRASFIQQLNMFETYLTKWGFGPKTQDWNEISESTFYFENEELLLRNTFLNARMGPLAEYSQSSITYSNKSIPKQRVIWADERRMPLVQEEIDEYDYSNKAKVPAVIIHHQVDSTNIKSAMSSSRISFGPKYTGEGKLDFYWQNEFSNHEVRKEEGSDFDMDIGAHTAEVEYIQRAKFVPVSNTRSNDLNSFNKQTMNQRQNNILYRNSEIYDPNWDPSNRNWEYNQNYHPLDHQIPLNNNIHQPKIMNNSYLPLNNELDSRNEFFSKSEIESMMPERKPLSNIQAHMSK